MNALAPAEKQNVAPPRVRGKLVAAIDLAITEGKSFPDAAREAGLSTRAMRKALEKPHVIRFIRERKALFRVEIGTTNEFRLAEIRDQNDNKMAAVAAIKTLENLERDQPSASTFRQVTPGVVVVINTERQAIPAGQFDQLIEVNPMPSEAMGG